MPLLIITLYNTISNRKVCHSFTHSTNHEIYIYRLGNEESNQKLNKNVEKFEKINNKLSKKWISKKGVAVIPRLNKNLSLKLSGC